MSFLKSIDIKDAKFAKIVIAGIAATLDPERGSGKTWRGKVWSKDELNQLIAECVEVGYGADLNQYIDGGEKVIAVNGADICDSSDFVYAASSDVALAGLYLYKARNSIQRGIEFHLSLADLKKIVSKKTCYFTGRKLVLNGESNDRPSLDRLNKDIGYTKDNTVLCCHWVNQLKNDLFENPMSKQLVSLKDMTKFVEKMNQISKK